MQTTPGSIAMVPVPEGWQWEYNEQLDTVVMLRPNWSQVFVSIYAPVNPAPLLRALLYQLGGPHRVSEVRMVRFAGLEGASAQVDQPSRDWLLVLGREDVALLLRGQTLGSFTELTPVLEKVARYTEPAPATWPPDFVGKYRASMPSSMDGGEPRRQDYYTLHPDGRLESSTFTDGTAFGVSAATGKYRGRGPYWEVRGNRLLIFDGRIVFTNFLVKALGNNLELHDQRNNRILAARH